MTELIIIGAASDNDVIGYQGKIPWHLPEDFKRFKRLTLGHPIIMGRKSYESLGKPLPGRKHVVLTGQENYPVHPGVVTRSSLEEALLMDCKTEPQAFIIGGTEVFKKAMQYADKIELTRVHRTIQKADAYFPKIDDKVWNLTNIHFQMGFSFLTYERRQNEHYEFNGATKEKLLSVLGMFDKETKTEVIDILEAYSKT